MSDLQIKVFPRSLPLALESVARLVPGYSGYASKAERRDEDRRLRMQIAHVLREVSQGLHRTLRKLHFEGLPPGVQRLGNIVQRLDRMIEDIGHAAYAYTGFFEPVRVDERRLELLYRADIAVAEAVQGLTVEVDAWIASPDLEQDGGSALVGIEVGLDLAETAWKARREMLAEE